MKGNTLLLLVIIVLLSGTLYLSYTNYQQIQTLKQENAALLFKIDSVQQISHAQSQKQTAEKPTQTLGSALLDFFIKMTEDGTKAIEAQQVSVTSKYRLENRYVRSRVVDPELLGNQTGEVVLDILVNRLGDVNSAKLRSATGITDEDVIEACKKAALKTDFNYDSDADYNSKLSGTITYTFSAK